MLRQIIKGSPVAEAVERLLRGTPGGCHVEGGHNPKGVNQRINRNNETVEPKQPNPAVIPMVQPPEKPKRKRDYSRERLLRGTPGAPEHFVESRPRNNDGQFKPIHNRNNDTVMDNPTEKPSIIPMPPATEKPKRKRDYSRESKQGNSVGYTLRRLGPHP